MPIRTILVAGINDPQNQAVRLCQTHFLKVTHIPELSTKTANGLPELDAAIIAGTAISQALDRTVKDAYKGKPIFYSNHGVSSFKEKFLEEVYGPGIFQKLMSDDVPFNSKVFYLLGRFFLPGDVIKIRELKEKVEKLLGVELENQLYNIMHRLKAKGMVEQSSTGHGSGNYTFKGLTKDTYSELKHQHGLTLEDTSMLIEDNNHQPAFQVKKTFTRVQPILGNRQGAGLPLRDEEEELEETPAPAPAAIMQPAKNDESAYLVLEALEKYEKRLEAFEKRFDFFEKRLDVIENSHRLKADKMDEELSAQMDLIDRRLDQFFDASAKALMDVREMVRNSTIKMEANGDKVIHRVEDTLTLHKNMADIAPMLQGLDRSRMPEVISMLTVLFKTFALRSSTDQNNMTHLS